MRAIPRLTQFTGSFSVRYTDIEKDLEVRGGIFLTGISREKLIQIFVRHNVVAVYLFGSQLKGTADPMSDVDIGVVFGGKGIATNDLLILQDDLQRLVGSTRVDLVLLEKACVTVAFNAISQGEVIYSSNDELRTDFEERVLRDYHDFTPFLKEFYLDVQEAIMEGDTRLDRERIMDWMADVRRNLRRLHSPSEMSLEDFPVNTDNFAIAEHHLRRSLEIVLDIGRHIIAKQALGRPNDYTEIFDILGRKGILPQTYLDKNRGLPGYRNRLVHLYHDVTTKELHEIVSTRLPDIEEFCQHILRYVCENS